MNKKIPLIILSAACLFALQTVFAAGTTSAVVDLNPIAFDSGMDLALYGNSAGLECLVYNPAFACSPGNTLGVSGGLMGLDMNYLSLAYNGTPFSKTLGIGAMVKYIGSGSIGSLDASGADTGSISPYDLSFYGVVAAQIVPQFSVGARIYLLQESMSGQSTGFGFDVGLGLKLKFSEASTFSAGLTALNIYTRLWDITQPIGLGVGVLMDSKLSGDSGLEYGLGVKADTDLVYSAGGAVAFRGKFKLGITDLDYKIGAGYYYSGTTDLLQGLRAGLTLGLLKNIHLGYDLLFKPWGSENRLSIAYTL